jgi:hypothetical protein
LCEGGDMISPWRRAHDSTYRPRERFWHRAKRRLSDVIWHFRGKIGI